MAQARFWYLQCPGCRYDLGWQPDDGKGAQCPECGQEWTRHAIERAIESWERYWMRLLVWPPFVAPLLFYAMWRSQRDTVPLVFLLIIGWVWFSWGAASVILVRHRLTAWLLAIVIAGLMACAWSWLSNEIAQSLMPGYAQGC